MACVHFKLGDMNGILTVADTPPICLKVNNKAYWFEMHRYCGPMVVKKNGDEGRHLGPNHNFWKAVSLWARQGERVDSDGVAIWERVPPQVCRKVNGRNMVVSGEHCDIWPQPIVCI